MSFELPGREAEGSQATKARVEMTSLRERFEDKSVLMDALQRQLLINGSVDLADAFAACGTLQVSETGARLVEQGSWDNDLFFILAGAFDVIINEQKIATRGPGTHVGELSGLKESRARTATLIAVQESLTLRVSQSALEKVAGNSVQFWKRMADVVADRLDQRNLDIGISNTCPQIFVVSSSEGLEVARSVKSELNSADLHINLWDRGTFNISEYPVIDLQDAIGGSDFVIAVVRADDSIVSRGVNSLVPRDNVSFEFGMSVGMLGRSRSILLVDTNEIVKLPSDLAGITTKRFTSIDEGNCDRTIAVACDDIRKHVRKLGKRHLRPE